MSLCPCGSGAEFAACCAPVLSGEAPADTAEALMRARYSAFVQKDFAFIGESLHPDHRHDYDGAATRRWAENSQWLGLEVVSCSDGQKDDATGEVEFIATYKDKNAVHRHHERSQFGRQDGRWYFVDGQIIPPETLVHAAPKVGRNDPCPCGSGRKFKKCCGQ